MTTLVLTLTVALVFYLNFKWGYSQPYSGLEHEVRERDYFFIASFAAWGVWVGSAWRRSPKRSSRDCHKRDGASPRRCSSSR